MSRNEQITRPTTRRALALSILGAGLLLGEARAAVFTVTNNNDGGAGSFRQAILNANSNLGTNAVAFALPGPGPFKISPLSALPVITNPLIIDATTQPGFAGHPIIELDGSNAGTNANGLTLTGGSSAVRGLVVNRFQGAGIFLAAAGNNTIAANFIGTDVSGGTNAGNLGGGVVIAGGSGNAVGGNAYGAGNTIAYNGGAGISILSGSNNLVRGNAIFQNAGLGIDLGTGGANAGQNSPLLAGVDVTGANILIGGSLSGAPNTAYQIDYYANPNDTLAGQGEGRIYLGWAAVTNDATGNASFYISLPGSLPVNSYVTATATDPANDTSEFSSPWQFVPASPVDLRLQVDATPNPAPLGKQVAYSIVVTNAGTNAASGVMVTDVLPPAMQYLYAYGSKGSVINSSNNLTFNLGTLAPGTMASMTIYATAQIPGATTNLAALTQKEFNLSANNSTNRLPVNVISPTPLAIATPPASQTLSLGSLLNLVVGVTGIPQHYQWRLNGANIPGATNATYSPGGLLASQAGSYTVVVSDQNGAVSSQPALVSLNGILSLPAGDNFSSAGIMLNLLGLTKYNNANATSEPGEPLHAGVPGGKSVWFTWTPLLSGIATFSTAGSSFDTLLAVYTGSSVGSLTEVASDDDSDGFYTSKVVFNAVAGTTYHIAIDGAYGASGDIVLNSGFELAGLTQPRIASQPATQVVGFGDTATFTVGAVGGGLIYQWYFNGTAIAGANGAILQITNVTAAQVGLYVAQISSGSRSARTRPVSLQISMLDGGVNGSRSAQDKFQAVGAALTGATQSKQSAMQPGRPMTVTAVSHSGGGTSRGYSSTQVFSTYGGGTQSGEPNGCGSAGGASSWTSVQAVDNGVMTIDTDGSSFNTVLAVYTGDGNDFSTLVPVACDVGDGAGGTNSLVSFAAGSNTVYYVAVDGVYGAYGTVVLNANLGVPPAITAQPAGRTVSPGNMVSLTAAATGYPDPNCQWWFNGTLLAGATNDTLTITNFQTCNGGCYQMTAVSSMGSAATVPADVLPNSVLHLDTFGVNLTNKLFQMRLVGVAGTNYVIQASTNLTTWTPLATNIAPNGLWVFTDNQSTNVPGRYYRAIPK